MVGLLTQGARSGSCRWRCPGLPSDTPLGLYKDEAAPCRFTNVQSPDSIFSAAAAVVLAHFFGSDHLPFAVGSDDLPGVYHSYQRFSEAAQESGLSRIYGGIHFTSANLNGLSTGAAVGNHVYTNFLLPKKNRSRE